MGGTRVALSEGGGSTTGDTRSVPTRFPAGAALAVGAVLGAAQRLLLVGFGAAAPLDRRIEVSGPTNSWSRLQEGAWLLDHGVSPYAGSSFHSSPLLLYFLAPLPLPLFSLLMVLADLASALVLFHLASATLSRDAPQFSHANPASDTRQNPNAKPASGAVPLSAAHQDTHGGSTTWGAEAGVPRDSEGSGGIPPNPQAVPQGFTSTSVSTAAATAALVYLLVPFRILASVGATTAPIHDLLVLSAFLAASHGVAPLAAFCWLLAAHLASYSALLALPLCLLLHQSTSPHTPLPRTYPQPPSTTARSATANATASTAPEETLLRTAGNAPGAHSHRVSKGNASLSPLVSGSLQFAAWSLLWGAFLVTLCSLILRQPVGPTLGTLLQCHAFEYHGWELTPNWGLRWYFFAEVFPEVREFFSFVFSACALLLLFPLALRLAHRPLFLAFSILSFTTIMAPYPSAADYGLTLSLLPIFSRELAELGWSFVVILGYVYSVTMGPIMFDLWCLKGIGNANFYYAVTLIFAASQGVLLVQSVWAVLSCDFKHRSIQ